MQERLLLPTEIHCVYAQLRALSFAIDAKPTEHPVYPGSTQFDFRQGEFYYTDICWSDIKGLGTFRGCDRLRQGSFRGKSLVETPYQGRVTNLGLIRFGQELICDQQHSLFRSDAHLLRCGIETNIEFTDELGKWIYVDSGTRKMWGFKGRERLYIRTRDNQLLRWIRSKPRCANFGDPLVYTGSYEVRPSFEDISDWEKDHLN